MTIAECPEPCAMPIVFVPRHRWRLIYQRYLDPQGDPSGRAARAQSMLQLAKARQFDRALAGNEFHPNNVHLSMTALRIGS